MESTLFQPKKYVLTGGPGDGKTTLIKTLKKMGYKTIPEAATCIIKSALNKGLPNPTHGGHVSEFQEAVAKKQWKVESKIKTDEIIFLDRGIIDGLAYCEKHKVPTPPPSLIEKPRLVNYTKVFVLDFIKEEYQKDSIRVENLKEAMIIHDLIVKHYTLLGYSPISVPPFQISETGEKLSKKESIAKRIEFILKHI